MPTTLDPVTWHRVTRTRIWNRQAYTIAARDLHIRVRFVAAVGYGDYVWVSCTSESLANIRVIAAANKRGRSPVEGSGRPHTTSVQPRPYRRP